MRHHRPTHHTTLTTTLALAHALLANACTTPDHPTNPPRPFTSDGCSVLPDGTPDDPDAFYSACLEHDLAYWAGGSYQDRLEADRQLRTDIEHTGRPITAHVAFLGVRLGGSPHLPTPWRWGFGYPYPHGYSNPQEHSATTRTAKAGCP